MLHHDDIFNIIYYLHQSSLVVHDFSKMQRQWYHPQISWCFQSPKKYLITFINVCTQSPMIFLFSTRKTYSSKSPVEIWLEFRWLIAVNYLFLWLLRPFECPGILLFHSRILSSFWSIYHISVWQKYFRRGNQFLVLGPEK